MCYVFKNTCVVASLLIDLSSVQKVNTGGRGDQ